MSKFTRRQLLAFFGASAGASVLAPAFGKNLFGGNETIANAVEPLKFIPVRLPHPLPIYQQLPSFLATGNGEGNILNGTSDTRLTSYTVLDDVIVPPEYERYVIVSWLQDRYLNRYIPPVVPHEYGRIGMGTSDVQGVAGESLGGVERIREDFYRSME